MSDLLPALVRLVVVTPEDVVFEGDVLWAQVPLVDGLVGIWPGHAPLIGRMVTGVLEYATGDAVETVAVADGILRVDEEGRCIALVTALTDGRTRTPRGEEPAAEEPDAELEALLEETLSEDVLREARDE